jgi:hypothetical protein
MDAPKYEPPPLDPGIVALQQRADADARSAAQDQSRQMQSSLMARYGTRLALAGARTGSPVAAVAPIMGRM